jgi:signal transduction histidine kinase
MNALSQVIEYKRPDMLEQMRQAFIRHAINNRGVLTSARRANSVAESLYTLFTQWMTGSADSEAIASLTTTFAQQGMALVTGMALLRVLTQQQDWLNTNNTNADYERLTEFQLLFSEYLSAARERTVYASQEAAQQALQRSLTLQLQQQEQLRQEQEQRSETLRQLLELNSTLAQLRSEQGLLDAAVSGLCLKLELTDVTIYQWDSGVAQWQIRTTTASEPQGISMSNQDVAAALQSLLPGLESWTGEFHLPITLDEGIPGYRTGSLLNMGSKVMGAIVARANRAAANADDLPLFLKTFAVNLTTLWRNLTLFLDARDRAQELEILHGRYVDSLWSASENNLQAQVSPQGIKITRTTTPIAAAAQQYPLLVGEQPIGSLQLPDGIELNPEQKEFLSALLRELGNALNNAQLLQVTRAYSTQLQVAAEVSRAASTFLQRDDLIHSVVSLIQTRFNFHYTALFLNHADQIQLQAESGQRDAGELLTRLEPVVTSGKAQLHQQSALVSLEHPAELILPLRTRDRRIGVLINQRINAPFSNQDTAVLQSLADQIATAIENATLFQQVQDNLNRTNNLYETGRRLTDATNTQTVFQTLVDFAAQSGLVDMCHTLAEDTINRDQITVHAFWRHDGQPFHGMPSSVQRNQFPLLERIRENQLFTIMDGQSDEQLDREVRALFRANNIRAAAFLPIQRNNQWFGTLALDRIEARPLTLEELQPFITLCNQAATILANQQLLRETGALYRISRTLNQAISQEDALILTVAEIAQYTSVPQCRVVLVEKKSGRGRVVAENMPSPLAEQFVFEPDDGRYQTLARQRQPLLLQEETAKLPANVVHDHLQQFGARYSLLVPLVSQLETIGWISLDTITSADAFTPANLNFVQTLADQLTTTLESIKLYDEAVQRNRELITLNQIGTTISGTLDLTRLGNIVYEQTSQLMDNTAFVLALYDTTSHIFNPLLSLYNGAFIAISSRMITPNSAIHRFLHTGLPFTANQDCPILHEIGLSTFVPPETSLKSTIWIPLFQENVPTGLIGLASHWTNAYGENEVQLLRSIATQTGLAIANAQLFQEIGSANEKLRQLDKLKTQFLANMSHELRTPLNSIIGFSRIMLKGIDGPITSAQDEDLTSINNSGQHLLNLINDILDQAKIEAGKMELYFQPVSLYEIASNVLATTRGLIKDRTIELRTNLEENLPLIDGDQVRLRQILMNFLSNAAKFTEEGHITLSIRRYGEDRVLISVADTGMGIDEKDFDKVFQAFEQVDSSPTRSAGGTGLGLPITRWLAKEHGGEIWFESKLGRGTTFMLTLPIKQTRPGYEPHLSSSQYESNRS